MITLPTLSQLYTNVLNNLESEYGVNISLKQKVALRVISATQASKLWLLYKVIGFLQKNIWPDTADTEFMGGTLERFGRVRLGRNSRQAVQGQYTVTVTGEIGAIVPAQIVSVSNDSSLNPGKNYILDSAHTMVTTSDTITLRALEAGTGSKLSIGDTLTFTSPVPLIDSVTTVTAETVQPLAAETTEAYRTAILNSFRLEAQGGAATDYRIWAQDAQGVAAVYPYAKAGETNANIIYVEATVADSIDGKGTPSAQIIADVEAVTNFNPDTTLPLNERGRRPNTVRNYFEAITPLNVNITITGGTFSATQQTAIINALTTAINAIRPYVAAADILANKNDIIDTNKVNGVIYSAVPGAVYTGVVLQVNAVTVLTYTFTAGNIPYKNTISFT